MNENTSSVRRLHLEVRSAEANGDSAAAIDLYKQILKQENLNKDAYNSLMKLYRRAKDIQKKLLLLIKLFKAMRHIIKSTNLATVKV